VGLATRRSRSDTLHRIIDPRPSGEFGRVVKIRESSRKSRSHSPSRESRAQRGEGGDANTIRISSPDFRIFPPLSSHSVRHMLLTVNVLASLTN